MFPCAATQTMPHHRLNLLVLVLILSISGRLGAAEVTVFAAASLTDTLKEIGADYSRQSKDTVVFNFGASSTLARQLEEGAPADLFFSADELKMDQLEVSGLLLQGTRKSRLSNSLVVIVMADSALRFASALQLTNGVVERIALADPKVVPAGIYARIYLEKLGIWSLIQTKIVPTENVRGALAAVESGNVDAGLVYRTDAGISKKVKIAFQVPERDGPKISYPMAQLTNAVHPAAAHRFLDFLESSAAAGVFKKYGFIVRQ